MQEITRVSVTEQVVDAIRKMVESGEIMPGEKLPPELALTKQFGVGRSTVREAICVLKAQGYVELIPGRGAFARDPGERPKPSAPKKAAGYPGGEKAEADFQMLRRLSEPTLAAEAAERLSADSEQTVIRAMAGYRAAVDAADENPSPRAFAEVAEADFAFHAAIAKASENTVAARLFADGHDLFCGYMSRWNSALAPYLRDTVQEHELIMQAVVGHGSASAQSRMLTHLTMAERRFS